MPGPASTEIMHMHQAPRVLWLLLACALPAALLFTACAPRVDPADLVLHNGKIVTVDTARPSAQALAVRGDSIVALGTDEEINRYIGDKTQVIDLAGKLAIPGFIDAHLHFMGVGEQKLQLDLTKAKNWDDIVAMVAEAAKTTPPGQPIRGRGWHQEKWDKVPAPNVEGFPLNDTLSKVSPNNPVYLTHASGHATIANKKAMELAGITSKTPDPEGGDLVRDRQGNPIGVFRENAGRLLRARPGAIPEPTPEEAEAQARTIIELAAQECLSKGVTSAHDAGVGFQTVDLYKKVVDEKQLGVRLNVMVNSGNGSLRQNLARYRMVGYGDKHLTVRTIKRILDGALGSRTAWLLEPYSDLPVAPATSATSARGGQPVAGATGIETMPVPELAETAKIAIENDFQLAVHAIGDRANREALNVFEQAFKEHPDKKNLRWRIEHAQHLNAADIPRFGQLGVIASMQGIHCTSDGPYVPVRLGPQRAEEGAYVWQKLWKTKAIIANGTDAPVEAVDTMPGFYALVTRKMKNGQAFYPDERLSREDALWTYTLGGAFAAFEDTVKGSLAPGKLADITILSKDIMTIPEDEILGTEVLYTIVGGKVLYKR
jgi:predicted amidohydrolase YtcJ